MEKTLQKIIINAAEAAYKKGYLTSPDFPDAELYASIYKSWRHILPFYRDHDAGYDENYADYRRVKFDEYLRKSVENLHPDVLKKWESLVREAEKNDLPKFQQQMTILARLEPETHRERRKFIRLENANIAVVYQGVYYFFPVTGLDGKPVDLDMVRSLVASIFKTARSICLALANTRAENSRPSRREMRGLPRWMTW